MRILVSGGSGFIGQALMAHLAAGGHEAIAFRRAPGGDGRDAERADFPADLDAVVHLAALNPERGSPLARDDAALTAANSAAAAALARRAVREGVGRFVFASTALVHAAQPTPIRPDGPTRPQNLYAASKLAGEEALAQALRLSGTTLTVLRLPPVYGPGGRGGVAALLRLARLPVPLPLGGGGRRSLLSLRNAADAFAVAATHEPPIAGTFLVADGEPLSVGEIVATLRRAAGRRPRVLQAPIAVLAPLARTLGKGEAVNRLFEPFVLDDAAFRERFGWRPPERTADALAALAG